MRKHLGTNVSFRLLDKTSKIIENYVDMICFSKITYHALPKNTKKIEVYSKPSNTAYEEEDCAKWIKLIASFGFKLSYRFDKEKNEHIVTIPIAGDNLNRAYLNSILMFVRHLTERHIYQTVSKYWELNEKYKPKTIDDKFQLMQYTHQYIDANSNHQIRDDSIQTCISRKTFKQRALERQVDVFTNKRVSVSDLWKGKALNKEYHFEKLKERKYMNVFVVCGSRGLANWIPNTKMVKTMEEADLVMFSGGTDVNPELYNEPRGIHTQYPDKQRDTREKAAFEKAVKLEIPIVGICRGLN